MAKKLEFINCGLCGNSETVLLFVENGFNTVRCKQCGMIYLNPRPAEEEIYSFYSEDYFKSSLNMNELRILINQKKKLRYIEKNIRMEKGDTILEVGCGLGYFLKVANGHGFKAEGVEISNFAAEYGKREFCLKIHQGKLEDPHYQDESFKVVAVYNLLSHLYHPKLFLREANRILKKNGFLVMRVGDKGGFFEKFNQGHWSAPEHVFHYTRGTLSQILDESGFKIIKNTPAFDSGFPYLQTVHKFCNNTYFYQGLRVINYILNKICLCVGFMDDRYVIAKKI